MLRRLSTVELKDEVKNELEELIDENIGKVAPGIVASVTVDGKEQFRHAKGHMTDPEFTFSEGTVFDMASLTKPIVTTTLVMKYLERGKLALEDSLSSLGLYGEDYLVGQLTVRSLITHTSGLTWHYHLSRFGNNREDYKKGIAAFGNVAKMYSREEYSDLNFMTLAFLLEHLSGKTLDVLADEEIFKPLGMKNSGFNPTYDKSRIAPTEITSDRGLTWGRVHDENSYYLGGVAGHAGLFSNIEDVRKFSTALLNNRVVSARTFNLMTAPANEYIGGTFGLGWMIKVPRPRNPSDSFGFSAFMGDYTDYGTFGHTGFTGTSLVLDPKRKVAVTILSNRVHPTRNNVAILRFRRLFHNAVFRTFD